MKKEILKTGILSLCLLGAAATTASATTIDLFEYAFNVDGAVSDSLAGDPVPAGINMAGFDTTTGLGTITATITGAGIHNLDALFDHEIDQLDNTYFNETGAVTAAAAAGQSWEIDEPGYVFGDIYANFVNSALDNGIGTPDPEDVSMAMGWDFILDAGETATINLIVSTVLPAGGFYLTQWDPDSDAGVYLSSNLRITGGGGPAVPEPCTMLLMGSGLAGLLGVGRRMRRS